jgi:SAM-dependent methyltransferase
MANPYKGTARPMSDDIVDFFRSFFDAKDAIVDVGSGAGALLWGDSVGIDLDTGFVTASGKRFVQGDVGGTLPFRDGVFDGAIAKDIIEHLAKPLLLMQELRRVTKPGSRLVVTTPRAVPRAIYADYTHARGFTRGAIEMLMEDAGWQAETVTRMGSFPGAGRLKAVRHLPKLMKIPGLGHYFGTNWLVVASR